MTDKRTPLDAEISAAYEWARTSSSDIGWQAPKVAEFCLHRTAELRAEVSSLESRLQIAQLEAQTVYEDYKNTAENLIAAESRLQAVSEAAQYFADFEKSIEPGESDDMSGHFFSVNFGKVRKLAQVLAPPTEPTERVGDGKPEEK
jgi:hypothetical protein